MSLTDQQRTETAADNCEVLRARLARYEDADGKPITTIAEQAREIERLNSDYNEACEDAMCVARELERQKMNCLNLLQQLEDLKAQSSGVVDAQRLLDWNRAQPEPRPIVIGREYQVAEACARLNSSPVSAGVVDERAAFETWYLGHFYMGDKQCGLEWLSTEPCGGYRHQHPAEQWIVWQARAALSAPNHSEQVLVSEPDFYWVEADEGSWNSPEEWAQDYYDYNGEKPESVSFSCAVELPTREYDSFEFDANGNCISCRLVAAAPSPSAGGE